MNEIYRTPWTKWLKAFIIDSVIIGTFAYALHSQHPALLNLSLFVIWALATLTVLFGGTIVMASVADTEGTKSFWDNDTVDRLAYSQPFLYYHVLTDLAIIMLAATSAYFFLAAACVARLIVSCLVIGIARKVKSERVPSTPSP